MNDLIRPALYQGYHEIIPVREHLSESCITTDVVGPICESGDFLAQNRDMTDVRQGELLAVLSAGAYGFPCPPTTIPAPWRKKCWWTETSGTSSAAARPGKTSSGGNPFRNSLPHFIFPHFQKGRPAKVKTGGETSLSYYSMLTEKIIFPFPPRCRFTFILPAAVPPSVILVTVPCLSLTRQGNMTA